MGEEEYGRKREGELREEERNKWTGSISSLAQDNLSNKNLVGYHLNFFFLIHGLQHF